MAARPLPSQERLLQLLSYNAETGELLWLPRPLEAFLNLRICNMWNAKYAGTPALACVSAEGYLTGHINGVAYKAHRVIWKMMTGLDPNQIDHIDGVRNNNVFSNLRDVDNAENQKNSGVRSDNKSGATGVFWYAYERKVGKWLVKLGSKHIGLFDEFETALAARKAAELAYGYKENGRRTKSPATPNLS